MDKERGFNVLFISASITLTDNYCRGPFSRSIYVWRFGDCYDAHYYIRHTLGMHEAIFANRSWM